MKSYFGYIRVSTVRQGEQGSSLQEQKAAIDTYAARNGLEVTAWFEERVTAAKQGRREFARMTAMLRAGKADGVIIHKIDRSARNLKDWAGLGDLIDAGIEVLFAHEALDMKTRGGRLAADIQAVVAADFIRNLKDEVRKGFYGRLKQGFYPLKAPRGYLDRGKCRLKDICPIEGPLVAQAFELYATGRYSLELLRHELARRGLTEASGKAIGLKAISSILRNPFYIGLMHIRTTGETFEGHHQPLVPKALFDRVQAILNGRLYPRTQSHAFLFRRLLKCARCGWSLSGERQKGHVYYRCHDRACLGVCVAEPLVESVILENLQTLALPEGDLGDLRDLLKDQIAIENQSQHVHEGQLTKELTLVDQRLGRATDALIDGIIDNETFASRKTELLMKRRTLSEALSGGKGSTFWADVAERFERAFAAYLSYKTGSPAEKRTIIEFLSSNLVVQGKKPVVALQTPFDLLQQWSLSAQCAQPDGAVRTRGRSGDGLARGSRAPVSALISILARHQAEAGPIGTKPSPPSPSSPPDAAEYAPRA
jgi:site-specific DNA recombinase